MADTEPTPDSIRARISEEQRDRLDKIIGSWRESELGGYDVDAVKQLGRSAI